MNTLTSTTMTDPHGKASTCIQFTIDNPSEPFVLNDIMTVGQQYTFSLWLMSTESVNLSVYGRTFDANSSWNKHSVTFIATGTALSLRFNDVGTYYAYHPQLEIGNKVTDWSPAPEDTVEGINGAQNTADDAKNTADSAAASVLAAETIIQQLADSITALVRDGNGGSLIKQDASGLWYFDISGIEKNISDTSNELNDLSGVVLDANGQIDVLKSTAAALQERTEYVRSYTDENDQPCLELGEGDSVFKVRITNTEIQFAEGSAVPAKLNRKMLVIEKAMVKNELQFGDDEEVQGVWIWKRRSNGNLGLSWKGVVS